MVSGDKGASALQLRVEYVNAPGAQRSQPPASTPAAAPAPSAPAAAPQLEHYHHHRHRHYNANGEVTETVTETAEAVPKTQQASESAKPPPQSAISGPRVVADLRSLRSLPQVDGVFCRHTFSKVLGVVSLTCFFIARL